MEFLCALRLSICEIRHIDSNERNYYTISVIPFKTLLGIHCGLVDTPLFVWTRVINTWWFPRVEGESSLNMFITGGR